LIVDTYGGQLALGDVHARMQ